MRKLLILLGLVVFVGGAWAADNATNTGTVKVATTGMVVTVKVPRPDVSKPLEVPIPFGKDATLPAGKYQVSTVQLYKPDAKGQVWCLNAIKELGSLKALEVTPGQAATVEGGETLKIQTKIVVSSEKAAKKMVGVQAGPPPPPTKIVTVYLDYIGKSGEQYGPKAIIGTAPSQARPIIRIKDENDKVLAEGQYAYGSSGFGGFG
ncbi:MAG: hypothetical protein NT049_03065 [Planctomycetota bacterium]|nr:hypothetical protein [Planctomycetota bacterium]